VRHLAIDVVASNLTGHEPSFRRGAMPSER
jgi:hypothetical protein